MKKPLLFLQDKETRDNFKIILLDYNPQNINKSGSNNYVYGVIRYYHMIGKNNLRKFIQILFDEFKIKDKRNFFKKLLKILNLN